MHPVRVIRASLTTFALRSDRELASTSTHKRPSFRRHFLPPPFALYSHPPVRQTPCLFQLLSLGLGESLARHFSNLCHLSPTRDRLASTLSFRPWTDGGVQLFVPKEVAVVGMILSQFSPVRFYSAQAFTHCHSRLSWLQVLSSYKRWWLALRGSCSEGRILMPVA